MLGMMALFAANLPPIDAEIETLRLECDISPNPTEVGQVIDFRAAASGGLPPYEWLWTVNGTEVATTQNTAHTFAAGGNYTVCITVTDSSEPENEKQCCTNVTVDEDLSLECSVSPNPTKVGHVTDFIAAASGGVPPYSWSWTVNGTEVATIQNITHTFATAGTYTVCVNVTDSMDNKEQCCTPVTVNPPLHLECEVSPNPTKVGQLIDFTAAASGGVPPYSWLWTVNGTAVATTQNTAHTFATGGTYTVCVNVTDSLDNKEQCCTNVTVSEDLSLECWVNPNPTKVGHVTDFTAAASGGNPPYSWSWTVDGTEVATTQNTTYTFATAGPYTVCVNVTDSSEPQNEYQCYTPVTVNPPLSLECDINPNPTEIGQVINFYAGASGGVPPYSWLWTVNGESVATTQNTAHTFATGGTYTVCVNVTDSLDNKEQCCTNVTVSEDVSLECWVSPNPTKVGHVTSFTAAASGGAPPYSWSWTVNGIEVATTQNTTYTFATAGPYNVCVNVTDSLDNREQCCTPVTVNPPLRLECDISPNPTEVGQVINFYAAASGGVPPYEWLWTVNGGPVATTQNTAHTFATGGTYTVCVNVTDSLDNEEQCCTPVTVITPAPYSLVLLPETGENLVDMLHYLTATVRDQFNNVMEGVAVTWNISGVGSFSGTPEGVTNADGEVDAVITSNVTGTSMVRCEVTGNPSVSDTATKDWTTAPAPTPSGGGGGCPPSKYLTVDWDGNITEKPLYLTNDRLTQDLLGPSPDGRHSLLLERATHAPTVDGNTHYLIVIRELEEIPPLPENTTAIVVINATPVGAFFDREIFLTLGFDELPENAQNVTMAYYDDVSGVWVPLESEAGGPSGVAKLTLSAPINHFSIFGVLVELAPTPPPPAAHFVPSGLSIVTSVEKMWGPVTFVTKIGESVTITANVLNDGGQEGPYTVELKLNGETVDTKAVTLGAGQSQPVSFSVSGLDYGQHEVEVAGLSGEFTTSRTITWWPIIVIIVAIGLISWGVVWWRRRKPKPAQEE